MAARNVLGCLYQPGKALSIPMREEIINLYNQGYHTREISRDLKVTERTVRNILDHFRRYGIVNPLAVGGSQTDHAYVGLMAGDIWIFDSRRLFASFIWASCLFSMSKFWVVGSYYCRPDWCNYNEYCCGDDICCDYLTGYWYLWLMMGLLLFSLVLVCCWLRYHRFHSQESVEARNSKLGYISVPGAFVTYGDEYYIHQQPPQVPFAREPPHFTETTEFESQQGNSSRFHPPPYNFIERTPSAPPAGP